MSSTVFEKKDGILTVRPDDRLDTATSPVLEREVCERLDGVENIVMGFTKVEYLLRRTSGAAEPQEAYGRAGRRPASASRE